jgi:hypothetical protein
MRWLLRGLLILVAVLVAFGATLYALAESREVVILHARDPDSAERATHLWIVDDAGAGWLRSSGRVRGWFVAVESNPQVGSNAPARPGPTPRSWSTRPRRPPA